MAKLAFHVDVPQPFNFELTVRKPAGWPWGAPYEVWERNTLYTGMRLADWRLVGLKLWERETSRVEVEVFSGFELGPAERALVEERVQLGLGIDDDLEGFYRLANRDPLVRKLRDDLYGMRLGFLTDVFERALLAITLQMAPLKRSTQMRECLNEVYGERVSVDGREVLYWPSPAVVAEASEESLRFECRLGYRAKAVKLTAQHIAAGFPHVLELNALPEEAILKRLQDLHGVGTYAAQIVSPKRGFPLDVWSARIFYELLRGETPTKPRSMIKEMEEEATRRWGAYRRNVFVYVLNDLPNLQSRYGLSKLS